MRYGSEIYSRKAVIYSSRFRLFGISSGCGSLVSVLSDAGELVNVHSIASGMLLALMGE
jgi:hypothetical protein